MKYDHRRFALAVAVVGLMAVIPGWAGDEETGALASAAKKDNKALLGSPDFRPTPERPLGWRSDGTGRYPGASPVTNWNRKVTCLTYDLRIQANKPKDGDTGKPVGEQWPMRDRQLIEWLIVGPFSVADADKGLDEPCIPDEATIEPSDGDKAGKNAWTYWAAKPWVHQGWYRRTPPSAKATVDPDWSKEREENRRLEGDPRRYLLPETRVGFSEVCGKPEGPVAAYAHTYLYAPRDGKVDLIYGKPPGGIRVWVNGKVAMAKGSGYGSCLRNIPMQKGWNRLLVKVINKPGMPFDEMDLKLWPSYEDYSYELKNIKWIVPAVRSGSGPITIVGDKLLVASDNADIACYSKADGRMQWIKTIHIYYSVSDEDKKANPAFKEKVEPLVVKMEALEADIVKESNAFLDGNPPSSKTQPDKLRNLCGQKNKIWVDIQVAMEAVDSNKYCRAKGSYGGSGSGGVASYAPATDGEVVCISTPTGLAGCFDLNGNRRWVRSVDPRRSHHGPEHGNNSSPVLIGGKVITTIGKGSKMPMTMVAYDVKTGNVAWDVDSSTDYNTPVGLRIGGVDVVMDPNFSMMYQVSDGKLLWKDPKGPWHSYAPTAPVVDGFAFCGGTYSHPGPWVLKIPATEAELATGPTPVVKLEKTQFGVGSPLYHDGLIYAPNIDAILRVSDAKTGKLVYHRWIPLHPYIHDRWGIYPSAALGGKYIYITDNLCSTLVLEPGREYKEVARNVLDSAEVPSDGAGRINEGAGAGGAGPVFEGNSIYFRTGAHLYCIAESK